MEKELNIAAILKDKPKGTKLYSTLFGDCTFDNVANDDNIRFTERHDAFYTDGYGKYSPNGECLVLPSKQMPNWSKFAWKKGDVLQNRSGYTMIFFAWFSDDYTKFNGSYAYSREGFNDVVNQPTSNFRKVSDEEAKEFIKKVEEHYGGKLNLETLEIEHTEPKQEFKDGDILYSNLVGNEVFIVKIEEKGILHSYVYMDIYNKVLNIDKDETFAMSGCIYNGNIRLATDSEKQQLFSALEKEGKRWNPDTKSIEDLPKKCEFKPMDWCLMKDSTKYWELCQFAYTRKVHGTTIYSAVGGLIYYKCIPYNEETKHLLGTTDEWKGGEG
jgi:hypothetical protein